MSVNCNSCGQLFAGYQELALHISTSKTGHRKGKRWAAKYISRHVINKHKFDFNGRTPLTTEQKMNKEDTKRVLSGGQRYAETVCPKCKIRGQTAMEEEFASSPQAWRIGGRLAVMCDGCGG